MTGFIPTIFAFSTVTLCCVITSDCFRGFDNLLTSFMSAILNFSIILNSLGIFLSSFCFLKNHDVF